MPQVSDIRLMVRAEQPILSTRTKVSYKDLEWTLARKRQDALALLRKTGEYMTDVPFIIYYDYLNMDIYDLDVEICFPVSCPDGRRRKRPVTRNTAIQSRALFI